MEAEQIEAAEKMERAEYSRESKRLGTVRLV